MTEIIADAAEGEVMYRDRLAIEGFGEVLVETVNFPPYQYEDNGYEYCGFETEVSYPDGGGYGNGPEIEGETAAQCHAHAVQHVPDGVLQHLKPDCGAVDGNGKPCYLKADQHPTAGQWTVHTNAQGSWPL